MEDRDLVVCAQAGDRAAFAGLLRRHWSLASGVCARFLSGDVATTEDVLQESAVVALVSLDRLADPDRFGAWLSGIALNVARRRLREARRERPSLAFSQDILDDEPGPAEQAEAADLGRRVRDAVAHLAAGQRDAVLLFYLQGLTHREVAAELGISINAVKARLHQARVALAPKLASLSPRKEHTVMSSSPTWVDVHISEVRRGADPSAEEPLGRPHVVVLTESSGDRCLPIWIGEPEATALAITLDSVDMPRPMTYQFAANLLDATEWRPREVRITDLAEGTFFAQVVLEHLARTVTVDARPSDALNLALVTEVPIRVDASVLDNRDATEHSEWRSYPTSTADLAAEVRAKNQHVAAFLQSLHRPVEQGDPDPET